MSPRHATYDMAGSSLHCGVVQANIYFSIISVRINIM